MPGTKETTGCNIRKVGSPVWWLMPLISAHKRLRQEDPSELEISLNHIVSSRSAFNYIVRPFLKTKQDDKTSFLGVLVSFLVIGGNDTCLQQPLNADQEELEKHRFMSDSALSRVIPGNVPGNRRGSSRPEALSLLVPSLSFVCPRAL